MGKSHRISLRMRWYRAGQRLGFRRMDLLGFFYGILSAVAMR